MTSIPRLGDIPPQLADEAFWRVFSRREHQRLDFKRGVPACANSPPPASIARNPGADQEFRSVVAGQGALGR